MATRRLTQFNLDLRRATDLVGLGQALGSTTNGLVDSSDLYRAALVHGVASLDVYVHGVVLDRAVDILFGRFPTPKSVSKLGLGITSVQAIINAPTPTDAELLSRAHVAQRLSLETFQRPDAIASALALVGINSIWNLAFPGQAEPAMAALTQVVQRRNRIVHECDADATTPGSVTPLPASDALDAIKTVESTIHAVDAHC